MKNKTTTHYESELILGGSDMYIMLPFEIAKN